MAKKAKIDYDEENDILWVYTGEKVKDSLEVDDFVIDFSSEDRVVGIEIMSASKMISNLGLAKIGKEELAHIKAAHINIYQSKEILYVIIGLLMTIDHEEREISVQVPAPMLAVTA